MPFEEYPVGHRFHDGKGTKRWVNTYHKGDVLHATHTIKDSEDMCNKTQLVTDIGFQVVDKVYHQIQYFHCVTCGTKIKDKEYVDVEDFING